MKMDNFRVLVLVATLAGVCVTAITYDSPVIHPVDKERVVTAGNNFTLECMGKYPLTWSFPDNPLTEENDHAESHISTREPTEDDENYGLRLDLYNVSGVDVGLYYCLYNTTDENKDISLSELESRGEAKSIYLFVDDPNILIVPMDSVVSGLQYRSLTIPCKPTSPNIDVKLYRGNDESEKREIELKPNQSVDDRVIRYHKHSGFLITEIGISDASYFYICKAEHNGVSQSTTFMLQITPYTSNIPKPHIHDPYFGRTVVGGKIHLECTIVLDTITPFSIEWKYPNKNIQKGSISISNTSSQHINSSENFPQILGKSLLDIHNVTEEDKGVYSCKIIVYGNNNTKTETKTINVLKKGTSIMKLSEPSNKTHLSSKRGKSLNIVVNIDSFPEPKITWYDQHQKPIASSTKYDVKVSNNQTQLQIKNMRLEDRGVYRVNGTSGNENASLSFTVNVLSPPTVEMDSEEFYMVGIKHNITCTATGYPLPKIKWFYQECEDVLNCNSSAQEINEFKRKQISDVTVTGTLEMEIKKSGNLMCYVDNKLGHPNISKEFYVTDIENGFGIIGAENSIAVGDNVSLTCAASSLKYRDESLNWYRLPENTLIKDGKSNDIFNHRHSTDYSKRLTLTISNIQKEYSGNYECRLENVRLGIMPSERRGKALNVTDVEHPKIIKSNLNNSVFSVDLGKPNIQFYCKAQGNPTPKIQWYKNYILFKPKDERIRISEDDTTLIFTHSMEGDEGKYSCIAANRIGKAEKYVELSLNYGGLNTIYIVIIVILLVVFLILICVLVYKIKKEKEIRKELSIMGLLHFEEGATESLNPDLGVDEQAELLPYDKKWEFPREKLKLGKQLGSGAFGVVMKASAYGILEEEESTTVAVKMVKRTADSTLIKALASELKIMVHLGKHLNVVNLLGACTKNVSKRELFVIVEYCRFGNLHNYLLRHRDNFIDQIDHNSGHIDPTIGIDIINRAYSVSSNKSSGLKSAMQPLLRRSSVSKDDSNTDSGALDTVNTVVSMLPTGDDGPITSSGSVQPEWRSNYKGDYNYSKDIRPISTQDLLSWSFQIARGMEYLANRKVLHGDLAARNILLADENIVKICDFGLAKNMYKTDNYKKKGDSPLPVKWMAIESIRDRVFSTQSDIWSYGIVLWELFSLARTPYPGMEADEKFYNRLVEGYRMEKPKYSNKLIYNIMLECWRARPVQRPTFGNLVDKLGHLLEEGVRKHYIDLNDPYMDMNNRWLAERGESDYLAMMSAPDYGNLTSANTKHDYVNEPFGGSTKINPLSPDDTDEEGYLRMTPAKNGTPNIGSNVFNFPSPASPKIMKSIIREESEKEDKKHEWVPMLKVENEVKRPGSDSDMGDSLPTSPNQEKSDSNT